MPTPQSSLFACPCGGTGFLSVETVRPERIVDGVAIPMQRMTTAARCLCPIGQLRRSKGIPLVSTVIQTTEELQNLYPAGIPDVLTEDDVTWTPYGPVVKARRRQIQQAYLEGVSDGRRHKPE